MVPNTEYLIYIYWKLIKPFVKHCRTKRNYLLCIIGAKLSVLMLCNSWCQQYDHWLCNEREIYWEIMCKTDPLFPKRKLFCRALSLTQIGQNVTKQDAIINFCLVSPFKEFRGQPLKLNTCISFVEKLKTFS